MNKSDSSRIAKDIRMISSTLNKTQLFKKDSYMTENVLKVLSYADNFDAGYGQRLRNEWQVYKDKGLENEVVFGEFKEKILQLAVDIETYFLNDLQNISNVTNGEKYIRKSIFDTLDNPIKNFNYKKLRCLLDELNSNYEKGHIYSCLMLIRAIIDHIPPLLGFKTFDQLVSNYPMSQTDRAYAQTLSANKESLHDALHRTISQDEDLFDYSDIPEKMHVNRILQLCLSGDVFAHNLGKAAIKVNARGGKISSSPPPIVSISLESVMSNGQNHLADFCITNKGQAVAVLKNLSITDAHTLDLGTYGTLGLNESINLKVELIGTEFRNNGNEAKLSIEYTDIDGNAYKSTYTVDKEKRNDALFNFKNISNFAFFRI